MLALPSRSEDIRCWDSAGHSVVWPRGLESLSVVNEATEAWHS